MHFDPGYVSLKLEPGAQTFSTIMLLCKEYEVQIVENLNKLGLSSICAAPTVA